MDVENLVLQLTTAPLETKILHLSNIHFYSLSFQARLVFLPLFQAVLGLLTEDLSIPGHVQGWRILGEFIRLNPQDPSCGDKRAMATLDSLAKSAGVVSKIEHELLRVPRREAVLERALSPLTSLCLSSSPPLALLPLLFPLVNEYKPRLVAVRALIALTNAALSPTSHSVFTLNGGEGISLALSLLPGLESEDMAMLDCALSAAFILCRVLGGEETSRLPPILFTRLRWVLQSVLDADHGIFMGSQWDPANILLDVATLCGADRNKPQLAPFLPLLVRSLDELGGNARAQCFALRALHALFLDESCMRLFRDSKADLTQSLARLADDDERMDVEAVQTVAALQIQIGGEGKVKDRSCQSLCVAF